MEKLLKTAKDRQECALWLDFLESEILPKGEGRLQTTGSKYCCIGIGCVVLIPENKLLITNFLQENALAGWKASDQVYAPEWFKKLPGYLATCYGVSIISLNDNLKLRHRDIARKVRALLADQL